MEIKLNDQNYDDVMAQDLPVVIDFFATWCGPCTRIAPVIAELADEYEGKVKVCKCDVDENEGISAKYGIRNIPTVLFIKGGSVVDKVVGAVPKSTMVEKFNALL